MTVAGLPYRPKSPRDAAAHGHRLYPPRTQSFYQPERRRKIFFLGNFPRHAGLPLLDRRTMQRRTREALAAGFARGSSPNTRRVETLTPGERQLVEIAKAVDAQRGADHLRRTHHLADRARDGNGFFYDVGGAPDGGVRRSSISRTSSATCSVWRTR